MNLFQKCKVGSTFKKSVQFTILIEKKENIIIISITEEKFNKIPLIHDQKFSKQLGIEKDFLNLTKASIKNLKLASHATVK